MRTGCPIKRLGLKFAVHSHLAVFSITFCNFCFYVSQHLDGSVRRLVVDVAGVSDDMDVAYAFVRRELLRHLRSRTSKA